MKSLTYFSLALGGLVALLGASPARAQFVTHFDMDGETIGVVEHMAAIGFNTTERITVYADHNTRVGESILARNNSIFNMSGGIVGDRVVAFSHSEVHITGGTIGNDIEASPGGVLNIGGGSVAGDAISYGTLNLFGGSIGEGLVVRPNGIANLYGGSIGDALFPQGTGIINVFGSDLLMTEVRRLPLGGREYLLTGMLLDGTTLNNTVLFFRGGQVVLNNVPEPGSVALLGGMATAGGMLVLRKRRKVG